MPSSSITPAAGTIGALPPEAMLTHCPDGALLRVAPEGDSFHPVSPIHKLARPTAAPVGDDRCQRIAIVTETFAPEINGVAMTLKRLVQGLRARGHELQLVAPQRLARGEVLASLGVAWLPVAGLPLPGYPALRFGLPARRKLRRLWLTTRPDVVYVATQGPLGWAAVGEARRLGIPVVSGFHTNFHVYARHYKLRWLESTVVACLRYFHNRTSGTLVPTQAQREELQRLEFRNVDVLRRGVDNALYHPKRRDYLLRAGWGVCKDDLAVIYVGRIAAEKNLNLAIRAFRAIQKVRPDARFVLVGDGPLASDLWEANPDFIFCGMSSGLALAKHYASGDLFLFPSLTETFGNVVLEAMASGLALVAYDRAAARVCVQHQENGWIVEPDDEAGFIAGAVTLATDTTLRNNVRKSARVCAEAFGWPQVVSEFERLLCQHVNA